MPASVPDKTTLVAAAEIVYDSYCFGEALTVMGQDAWQERGAGHLCRAVRVRNQDGGPPVFARAPKGLPASDRIAFHVRFARDGSVIEATAIFEASGERVGFRDARLERALRDEAMAL